MTASTDTPAGAEAQVPPKQNGTSTTPRHEEYQYLDLVREILEDGEHRPDRYRH